jgi:hypothetical protein
VYRFFPKDKRYLIHGIGHNPPASILRRGIGILQQRLPGLDSREPTPEKLMYKFVARGVKSPLHEAGAFIGGVDRHEAVRYVLRRKRATQ